MIFPRAEMVHRNLSTAHTDFPALLSTLKTGDFSGIIKIEFPDNKGSIFVDSGGGRKTHRWFWKQRLSSSGFLCRSKKLPSDNQINSRVTGASFKMAIRIQISKMAKIDCSGLRRLELSSKAQANCVRKH